MFHLSQIAPRRQPIKVKEPKTTQKTIKAPAQSDYDRLCAASLNEAIRNFKLSPNLTILDLPLSTIIKPSWSASQCKQQQQQKIKNDFIKRLDHIQNKLRTSYVSCDTFQENKIEPIADDKLTSTTRVINSSSNSRPNHFLLVTHLVQQLSQSTFHSMQIRGFKTNRNIESQLKRNPTILSRIQKSFRK